MARVAVAHLVEARSRIAEATRPCTSPFSLAASARPKIELEPGDEIGIGGLTLIAESSRSVALRGFRARLVG
jgi:hypothetical protein